MSIPPYQAPASTAPASSTKYLHIQVAPRKPAPSQGTTKEPHASAVVTVASNLPHTKYNTMTGITLQSELAMKAFVDVAIMGVNCTLAWNNFLQLTSSEGLKQGDKLFIHYVQGNVDSNGFCEMEFVQFDKPNHKIELQLITEHAKTKLILERKDIVIIKYNEHEIDFTKSPEDQKQLGCCAKCTVL